MLESSGLHEGPDHKDIDSWPQLTLTSFSISLASSTRSRSQSAASSSSSSSHPVDLFDVCGTHDQPVRVVGRLQKCGRGWKNAVRSPLVFDEDLVIPQVETFSMELVKGVVVIWVLGEAGWYKLLEPKEEYSDTFEMLREKARIWLWIREWRGGQDVLRALAGELAVTRREARMRLQAHCRFLLTMMLKPPEGDVELWKGTRMWEFLSTEFEGLVEEALSLYGLNKKVTKQKEKAIEPAPPPPPPPTPPPPVEEEAPAAASPKEPVDDPGSTAAIISSSSDGDEEPATPEHDDDDDSAAIGKTVSTKGRSVLRPSCNEVLLDAESLPPLTTTTTSSSSPSPSSPSSTASEPASPSDLRLKRRLPVDLCSPSGSQPKRTPLSPPPQHVSPRKKEWKCSRCNFVVANAKSRDGRLTIERHYETHGRVVRDAEQIIEMEAAAGGGHRRVDHLMEKIRGLSKQWEEGRPTPMKGLGE
ncbi:hypothetical protein FN846DRAFT_245117 [Sphaerosporella brunnea]|uniref:RFTS domain-containing protein n=1 Tax=Sphaerosporella brunnea TaxID=1250544 RepID=A0A5J5FC29_9PEZI|nr:hypothetical protein FN846DRAFT_245117 [Sphaerosporella brunnea]